MAGDWIKMRPSLMTSPKINGIAKYLEEDSEVSRALTTGFSGRISEVVTRNVMRNVTVASLLVVWGAANEHTSDGVFTNADLSDIDDMVGIPGFGAAMESVGWAEYDADGNTVTFPNFNEYNTCGRDRANEKNAERQRRYREKQKQSSNANSNVTDNVTNNDREEKRREENIKPPYSPPKGGRKRKLPDDFELSADMRRKALAYWQKQHRPDIDPDDQFQRFKAHHTAKGSRMENWECAWQTWYSNAPGMTKAKLSPVTTADQFRGAL